MKLPTEICGVPIVSLRDDQIKALDVIGQMIKDVVTSQDKLLFAAFYVGEPDLFKDRPVMVVGNLKKQVLKDIVSHAYDRLVIKNKGKEDHEE